MFFRAKLKKGKKNKGYTKLIKKLYRTRINKKETMFIEIKKLLRNIEFFPITDKKEIKQSFSNYRLVSKAEQKKKVYSFFYEVVIKEKSIEAQNIEKFFFYKKQSEIKNIYDKTK